MVLSVSVTKQSVGKEVQARHYLYESDGLLYAWLPVPTTTTPYWSMETVCARRVVQIYNANATRHLCFVRKGQKHKHNLKRISFCSAWLEHRLIISVFCSETKFSVLSFLGLSLSHNSTLYNAMPHPLSFPLVPWSAPDLYTCLPSSNF